MEVLFVACNPLQFNKVTVLVLKMRINMSDRLSEKRIEVLIKEAINRCPAVAVQIVEKYLAISLIK